MTPPAAAPLLRAPRGAVRRTGRAVAALMALLLALVAAPVRPWADEGGSTAVAKKHFYRGEKLFALGRFRDALAAYERAFEAEPLPELLFNIGQCHRNLGDYRSAVFSFRKYLRLVPDADNREAVEKLIAELEREMARADVEARERAAGDDAEGGAVRGGSKSAQKAEKSAPFYKRWWFWTGVVVVGAGGTAAVLLQRDTGVPDSDLGNWDFSR